MWPFKKKVQQPIESPYTRIIEEGNRAGLEGAECWENPYVMGQHEVIMTQAWYAGWCRGRQQAQSMKRRAL